MANTTVGAQVNVEFASVGQMRKAIKEATSDLIAMQEQFGKTSPQAIAAAKRIAELKDRIQDAKEQADLFDPGKRFSAFANAANQIAAGFSAVQGAMALVGTESEDLQKTLVKVQGAIALSQGLSQLKDLGKAYDEIKIVAVDAFKSIRAAISSTGIGLLVVALGTIVAYWDDIKEAVSGVSEEQKKLGVESKKGLKTEMDKVDALNNQDNILKLQGKSEKEILKDKIKQYDITIEKGKADLLIIQKEQEAREKAAARNAEITKQILTGTMQIATAGLRLLAAPIDALILTANKVSETLGFGKIATTTLNEELTGVIDKVSTFTTSFLFDPNKVKEDGKKTIKESQDTIKKLENDRAGLLLQIKEIDKKDAADRSKIKEDNDKAQAEKDAAAAKVLDDARRAKLTEQQREEEDAIRAFQERKKTLELAGNKDFTAIREQLQVEFAAIRKKYADAETKKEQDLLTQKADKLLKDSENEKLSFDDRILKIQERQALENQLIFESEDERKKFIAENQAALTAIQADEAAKRKLINEAEIASKQELLIASSNVLGELSNLFGQSTAAGKAAALAQIAINAGVGFANGLRIAQQTAAAKGPGAAFAFPIFYATQVAAVLSAINRARSIVSQVKGGGGGGGSIPSIAGGGGAPVAAQPSPTVTATAVNTQAVNNLGNQAMRAYVLNSDITNNDQKNAYLQRNARLG